VTSETVELPVGVWADGEEPVRTVRLRPLCGHDEDWLAARPDGAPAAEVVTGLLARVLTGAPEDLAGRLPVGDREWLLLRLRAMTSGPDFDAVVTCPACGEPMDVSFSAADVPMRAGAPPGRPIEAVVAGVRVRLRLPTGADQEAAARADGDAARVLLDRCVVALDGAPPDAAALRRLDEAARAQLDAALAAAARGPELSMDLRCPECGHEFGTDFDVAAFLLDDLHVPLPVLLREVHALAVAYGWSERDVLDLGRIRRRTYIALVRAAEEAPV
jgi:hypothetical protein